MPFQNANNLGNSTHVALLFLNDTEDLEVQFQLNMNVLVILLFLLLVISLTIVGNILVMLAFIVDKRLRTQSNFFLLNLAICDFVIGSFTGPLYVPYMLTGKWMLGSHLCHLWLIMDYTMCAAAVFNVALISYDRFLSVTKAVLYRSSQKKQSEAFLKMAVVWILSFLLYSPSILASKKNYLGKTCRLGYYDTWYFHLVTSAFDFFVPLICISFFNLSIYWNITKRQVKKGLSAVAVPSGEKAGVLPFVIATNKVLASVQIHREQHISTQIKKRGTKTPKQGAKHKITSPQTNPISTIPNNYNIQVIKISRDKKVAKSLAVLVLVFAICWAPYNLLVLIDTTCPSDCVAVYWYDIAVWVLYFNSAINPILYPLCHKSFRRAFKLLLQLFLKSLN